MSLENAKSLIRSCVVSTKKGLTIRQLKRDFEDLVGSPIPYQEHGFQSLELFLRSMPDTVRLTPVGNETLVEHVHDPSVARIASLVSRQRGKSNKYTPILKKARSSKLSQPALQSSRSHHRAGDSAGAGGVGPTLHPSGPVGGGGGGLQSGRPAASEPGLRPTAPARRDTKQSCSESEGDGGAGPARRAHSVAPAGRCPLTAAAASLSISTSDLSGGGRSARAAPALCPQHRPPHVCRRPSCESLHICRLFVDGFCPTGDADCRWGHTVASDNNGAALSAHQLQALPETDLLWMVRALLHQTAPVAAEEYHSRLAICAEYADDARCRRSDCFGVHLCPRLAAGLCRDGDGCRWSHRLTDPDNVMVLLRLRCAQLSETQVLQLLARSLDGGDSDSAVSERGGTDTESEWEPTDTDGELPPRATASAGAESSVRSSRNSETDARTSSNARDQRAGAGSTGDDGEACSARCELGAAERSSEQRAGPTDGSDRSASAPDRTAHRPAAGNKPADCTAALSKEEMIRIAETLDACHYYCYPSKCLNKSCKELHLCRFYLAGICPYVVSWCSRSHKLTDPHNKGLLSHHQLLKLPQADLLKALRDGHLSRNPITNLERRFLVQMCRPYQQGQCKLWDHCPRVHICGGYMSGECERSSMCGLSHNLNSQHNAAVVRGLGLYSLTAKDIKEFLENPIPAKKVWESAAPKEQRSAPSRVSVSQPSAGGELTSGGGSWPTPTRSLANSRPMEPPAASVTTNAGSDQPPRVETEEAQTVTTTASSLAAEAAQPAGRDSGDGASLESKSGLGSEEVSGGSGASHPRDQARQPEEPGAPPCPVQPTESMNGTSQSQQTAGKSVPKQLQSDKTSDGKTTETLTKKDMMDIACALEVCRDNFYPSKCKRADCNKLHLCRFFIASKCTFAVYQCLRSHHLWNDPHNNRLLCCNRLEKLSERDILKALRDGYLARNPITNVERRYLLQMCRPYQRGHCKREKACTRLHICDSYILGNCPRRSGCGLSHDLNSQYNTAVVRDLGLCSLTAEEIREVLGNPVTARAMWASSGLKQQRTPSSDPKQDVVAQKGGQSPVSTSSHDGQPPDSVPPPAAGGISGGQSPPGSDAGSFQPPDGTVAGADSSQPVESMEATVAPDSQPGSVAESDESDDDSIDLPDDGPALCAEHASGSRCQRADCDSFHICGFYLANLCHRPDASCPLGHSFGEAHNVQMMDVYGLLGGSPEHFQDLLDQMTLRARITFSNEAEEKVSMCIPYNSPGGCKNEDCCGRFHLCNRFLAGTCTKTDCGRHHDLGDEHNRRVRELLGLAATPGGRRRHTWATNRDVIELIRAKLGVKPGMYESVEVVDVVAERAVSAAEDTEPKGEESDNNKESLTEETKSVVAETGEETAETASTASNEAKSVLDVPQLVPEPTPPCSPVRPAAGSKTAPLPPVCSHLIAGRRCPDSDCGAVHVCPHFLAGACRRQHCTLGHRLDTEPNRRPLLLAGRAVTGHNHDTVVRELYAASDNVPRAQVYNKLRICISNNHAAGCKSIDCPYIHICQRFVGGTCAENGCVKGHSVATELNRKKLGPLKLEDSTAEGVLEMLRAVHGIRSVCK